VAVAVAHIGQMLEQALVELVELVAAVMAHLLQETTNLMLVEMAQQIEAEVVAVALTHLSQLVSHQQVAQAAQELSSSNTQ
jgi:hypothetical protein